MSLDSGASARPTDHVSEDAKHSDQAGDGKAKKRRRRNRRRRPDNLDGTSGVPRKSSPHKPAKAHDKKDRYGNRPLPRGVYSAIDLGTNNCRLLIATPTKHGFRVIDAFSRVVRLGEGLSQTKMLSEAAMDRTIDALKVCAEKIGRRQVTCMRHVATEACRIAGNSQDFLKRIKDETGLNLDIISAGEEARLAVMGCQSLIAPGNKNALVFDIGGGSTELIWVRVKPGLSTEILGWMSIPWGVVNLSEKYGLPNEDPDYLLPEDVYEEMISSVRGHLQSFEDAYNVSSSISGRRTQFLGTSGTVTTLASLHLKLPRYIRDRVDGAWMKAKDIRNLSRDVAGMSYKERAELACIGRERADLVVAGCAILEAILGMWKVPSLRVADRGIREGILRGMMNINAAPTTRKSNKKQSKHFASRHKQKNKNTGKRSD